VQSSQTFLGRIFKIHLLCRFCDDGFEGKALTENSGHSGDDERWKGMTSSESQAFNRFECSQTVIVPFIIFLFAGGDKISSNCSLHHQLAKLAFHLIENQYITQLEITSIYLSYSE